MNTKLYALIKSSKTCKKKVKVKIVKKENNLFETQCGVAQLVTDPPHVKFTPLPTHYFGFRMH